MTLGPRVYLIVLSAFAPVRTALAGLAAQEGFRPVAAETIHECVAALEHHGKDALVLLDAMHDAAMAEAILPIAEASQMRIALLSGRPSEHLRFHEAVRYHLAAPFPSAALRTFLRALNRSSVADRAVSGTRVRREVGETAPDEAAASDVARPPKRR